MSDIVTKTALAYAIGMVQSLPSHRQDDGLLHYMRTDILRGISAMTLASIVTGAEMQPGKAVRLYHDYMDPTDPADILFKATYDRARGLEYADLIQSREQRTPIGKSPDPSVMAKRAGVCLDDEINKSALLKAHNEAVDAFAKLHAALDVSATMLDLVDESDGENDLDEIPTADPIDLDDLPISNTTH